jgi:hypothetical protein
MPAIKSEVVRRKIAIRFIRRSALKPGLDPYQFSQGTGCRLVAEPVFHQKIFHIYGRIVTGF